MKAIVSLDGSPNSVCKITLFQQLVHSGIYDVICVCETWLNDSVMNSEILSGYSIFPKDRVDCVGCGILVASKSNIQIIHRQDLDRQDAEL